MSHFVKAVPVLLACFITVVSLAQEACPDIVLDALGQMENACAGIGRNEVCYGNGSIVALDTTGEELPDFAQTGDITEVTEIGSLSLSGMKEDEGLWGLAVLSVQADIPNTIPGQNVTMLLFGESELSAVEGDASAFVFSAGIGQLTCDEAPNGLVIQTPEGVGTINLSVNNIAIELGSTAYITAEADGEFSFALLEGHATLSNDESEVEVNSGEFTTVELDEELNPVGEFAEPQAIEGNLELPQLPLELLPREVPLAEATAASGEIIIPRPGSWEFETTTFEASDACPAMVVSSIQSGMAQQGSEFATVSENWDFETFYQEANVNATGMELPAGTYSSPAPNVYVFETQGGGDFAPFTFTMTVISETEIEGGYFIDSSQFIAGCTFTTEFTAVWSD